jgi:hypothetical protein
MKTIKFHDFLAKNYEKSEKTENLSKDAVFLRNLFIILAVIFFGADIIHTVADLIKDLPIGLDNPFK